MQTNSFKNVKEICAAGLLFIIAVSSIVLVVAVLSSGHRIDLTPSMQKFIQEQRQEQMRDAEMKEQAQLKADGLKIFGGTLSAYWECRNIKNDGYDGYNHTERVVCGPHIDWTKMEK